MRVGPPPRPPGTARSAGLVLSALAAAAWAIGIGWHLSGVFNLHSLRRASVVLERGHLSFYTWPVPTGPRRTIWRARPNLGRPIEWLSRAGQTGMVGYLRVPLWIPFALVGGTTVRLWWRDRGRARSGCCPACGYDLAGLAAGAVCPECGRE